MSYDGIEIDMLSLGDADCILVTQWYGLEAQRVLIDGGNKGDINKVRSFLHARGVQHLDDVICTHPHDDHAGGLVNLLDMNFISVGRMWMHIPQNYVDPNRVTGALNRTQGLTRARVIQESLQTVSDLETSCHRRRISISEPFQGDEIGMLTVIGPSCEYYRELVAHFSDPDAIRATESLVSDNIYQTLSELILEGTPASTTGALLPNPNTTPENNSTAILGVAHDSKLHLFTGDAGAQALTLAAEAYNLQNCHWMQIPHHGSRRNITESLITHFQPRTAFVSAAGNLKHPRQAVVNAFKRAGARVYSTHYPDGGHLWHHQGNVPERPSYRRATPLYEA